MRFKVRLESKSKRKAVEFMVIGESLEEATADLTVSIFEMVRTPYPGFEGKGNGCHFDKRVLQKVVKI